MKSTTICVGDFDWTPYEDGYNGKTRKINKSIIVPKDGTRTKILCHEPYAQELYNMYNRVPADNFVAKDMVKNSIFTVTNIMPVSKTEVIVDTIGGGSARIDLTKDKEYLNAINCNDIEVFVNSLAKSENFKKNFLDLKPTIKVINKDRISLWEGHKSKTEKEFMEQIKNPTSAYYAKLEAINNGGYIANIQNIKCFLPGSLAQANKIIDYDALIGKTIPVMIDSYTEKTGFIVSYKKYLATILPSKIANELSIGMDIIAEVTGIRKGNCFAQFADSNGDMIFTGLLPRDNMSDETKADIDAGLYKPGSKIRLFISDITETNRIVFSDSPVNTENDSTTVNDF